MLFYCYNKEGYCDHHENCDNCEALIYNKGGEYVPTNGERIRAISDEELVKVLAMMANGNVFDLICDNPKRTTECDSKCVKCIAEWLKQPAEEDRRGE